MSAGRKSTNAGVRTSRTNADAARKWVAEETRAEAKEVFTQHTKETSSLDVLSRCKKLNELLSSDVLKGKGDPKAQLKEILGILHAGPKRPAFLDKPSVTATAGKRGTGSGAAPEQPAAIPATHALETAEALRYTQQQPPGTLRRPSEDVEDVISLLNSTSPPNLRPHASPRSKPAQHQAQTQREQEQKEAERQAERQRLANEAEQKRRAQEEAERIRKQKEAQDEADRQHAAAAADALRLQRLRHRAALCIQSQWRGHCARRQAAQRRQQLAEQHAGACVLQAAWRARRVARAHRERLAAAAALQCAVRAWRARRRLHLLRVEAFTRQRAARIIQRAFCAFRARYTLGPLRVPPQGGARPSSRGLDGSALLAMQLRLRSAVDTRLAPECAMGNSSGGDDDSARQHRTVVTHMERVRQVSATERNRRCDVSERVIMVASEHRDNTEALAIARQGFGVATPRTSSPSASWVPPVDSAVLDNRRGSGSWPCSEAGGQPPHTASSGSEVAAAMGARPASSLRRMQGSSG